jgi:hypothetical protein
MNQIKVQRVFSPTNKKTQKSSKARKVDRLPKLKVDCKVNSDIFLQNLTVKKGRKMTSIKKEGNPLDHSIQFARKSNLAKVS